MFYHKKTKNGFFIWNDFTEGKYGPFKNIYSKNNFYGEKIFSYDISDFPGYKFSLGFTQEKIFILDEEGKINIKEILKD